MTLQMRASHRFASTVGALCLGAAALMGAVGAAQAEKLRLGNEGVYPPFSMISSTGTVTGVEADLAREMCKRMNVECEFVIMEWKALIPSLLQGKFETLVSQTSPTPERKQRLSFTRRLFANLSTFIVPVNSSFVFTKEGIRGKGVRIGLQRGGAGVKYLQDLFGDAVEHVLYDNPDQVRMDLLAGRINVGFMARINATIELINKPEGKDWKLDGGEHWLGDPAVPQHERGNGWVVKKGDEALLKRMDAALESIIADCTYTKIRKPYLNIATLPEDAACAAKTH
jgi:arginine/ornithine transport system substrate-binding protein